MKRIEINELSDLKDFVSDDGKSIQLCKKVIEKALTIWLDPHKKYSRKRLLEIVDQSGSLPKSERGIFEFKEGDLIK